MHFPAPYPSRCKAAEIRRREPASPYTSYRLFVRRPQPSPAVNSFRGDQIPAPSPTSNSSSVACARRGYQASGAAMVRPSASSTDSVSSPTSTRVARAIRPSTAEEFIPALQQLVQVLLDQSADPADHLPAEAVTALQPDR